MLVIALVLASCGEAGSAGADEVSSPQPKVTSTTVATAATVVPVLAEPVPLLVIAETGGCFMMGPNCSTTLVMSDGSFGVFRTDPADVLAVPDAVSGAELVGRADVHTLARIISDTDFADLRTQLEPGTCQGCFDGIDVNVRFHTAQGPVDVDSVTYSFDHGLELFQHLEGLQQAIRSSGGLEPMQRGG